MRRGPDEPDGGGPADPGARGSGRDLGPHDGFCALLISFFVAKTQITGRAVVYAVASGVLGTVIVGSVAVAAGEAGVARALSLVIAAQLITGLVLDALGLFGAGADFTSRRR